MWKVRQTRTRHHRLLRPDGDVWPHTASKTETHSRAKMSTVTHTTSFTCMHRVGSPLLVVFLLLSNSKHGRCYQTHGK